MVICLDCTLPFSVDWWDWPDRWDRRERPLGRDRRLVVDDRSDRSFLAATLLAVVKSAVADDGGVFCLLSSPSRSVLARRALNSKFSKNKVNRTIEAQQKTL